MTVTAGPPRTTRSPSSVTLHGAAAGRRLVADELGAARGARPRTGRARSARSRSPGPRRCRPRAEVARHEVELGVVGRARSRRRPRTSSAAIAAKSGASVRTAAASVELDEQVVARCGPSPPARRRARRPGRRAPSIGLVGERREVELDRASPDDGRTSARRCAVWNRDRSSVGAAGPVPQHVRGRERRVAAQGDLDRRREPAQVELAVGRGDDERGLREVHLRRDRLHPRVGRRDAGVEQAHRGGVAAERRVGERVDVEQRARATAARRELLDDDEDVAGADGVARLRRGSP